MSADPPPTAGTRGRKGSRTGALMAAAVLLAGACSSSHHPRAQRAASTSIPAPTTTEPPPQYAPSPYLWDRVSSPALARGGGPSATLSAVMAPEVTGPWLLFGSRLGPAGTPSATLWSSPDAANWTGFPLDARPGPSQVVAAARYRASTVAVGSVGEGDAQQASVWLSPGTGTPFAAQSVPSTNGPSAMTMVAAGALGMFAVGTVDGRFAMWSSTNGRQWSELPGAEKVIAGSPGARVNALMAEGDNVYAAGSLQSGAAQQAALWSTTDGLNWHLVDSAATSFAGPAGRVVYSLAPLGTGLVAVGAVQGTSGWVPASWISPDGQSWSLPSEDFPSVPHPVGAAAALGPSGGMAARSVSPLPAPAGSAAVVATGGGPYGQAVWRSADGMHWTSLSLPASAATATSWRAERAAGTDDTTVVIDVEPGQPYLLTDHAGPPRSSNGSAPAAIAGSWSEPSADPAVFGAVRPQAVPVALQESAGRLQLTVDVVGRPQTIGVATVATVSLSSQDGSTWVVTPTAAGYPPTLPAPGSLTTRLPTGWVAVASRPGYAPEVWTSVSGLTWKKAAVLSVPTPGTSGPATTTTTSASAAPGYPGGVDSSVVNGVCAARLAAAVPSPASPRYVVASVGAAATTTISPAAWLSPNGEPWRYAPVSGGPSAGATSYMSGCLAAGSGLAAFGSATGPGGAPEPALWRSSDGTAWTRLAVAAFASGRPNPILSMAVTGDYWLAAANPDPMADPFRTGTAGAPGPAASAGQDAGVGPSPSLQDGRDGVWLSTNGGASWQPLDTSVAPWSGAQDSQVDLAAFAKGAAVHATSSSDTPPVPVIVGVVDGELAVWTGTPAPSGGISAG